MSASTRGFLVCLAVVGTCGVASAQVFTGPEGNYHTPESLYGQYQGQGAYAPGYRGGYYGAYGQGYPGYRFGYAPPYAYPQPYGYAEPYGYGYYGGRTTREGDYRY